MRNPIPAALLVDHPFVRAPKVEGLVTEWESENQTVPLSSLSRRDRYRAAVQLTAAAALFADFDLWFPGPAFHSTQITRKDRCLRAGTSVFPVSLKAALERLGGGEAAVEEARRSVLRRIAATVGLEPAAIDIGKKEPGFFLEGAVIRQLRELPRPLDPVTARALWAFRWDPLPQPEEGTVQYWRIDSPSLARRMAGALFCELRLRNHEAWLWPGGGSSFDNAPAPSLERPRVLILVGDLSHAELGALSRWARRKGCSAVAVGTFPNGWRPLVPPVSGGEHVAGHLAVVGLPMDQARIWVDQRQGNFNPLSRIDRNFVTSSAQTVFSGSIQGSPAKYASSSNEVSGWLELSPRGLPAGFLAVQTGLTPSALEAQREAAQVIAGDGRWRLADPVLLRPDPRHKRVAELYESDDPLHVLHMALGNNDPGLLLEWARGLVDNLEDSTVRAVLSQIEPGTFGSELQLALAEACLSMKDPAAARAALALVRDESGRALTQWMENLDRLPGTPREPPAGVEGTWSVRAVAETGILTLREIRRNARSGAEKSS